MVTGQASTATFIDRLLKKVRIPLTSEVPNMLASHLHTINDRLFSKEFECVGKPLVGDPPEINVAVLDAYLEKEQDWLNSIVGELDRSLFNPLKELFDELDRIRPGDVALQQLTQRIATHKLPQAFDAHRKAFEAQMEQIRKRLFENPNELVLTLDYRRPEVIKESLAHDAVELVNNVLAVVKELHECLVMTRAKLTQTTN